MQTVHSTSIETKAARCALLASLVLSGVIASEARAQNAPAQQQAAAPSADDIKQRAQELDAAREAQKKAAELQDKLRADIAAIGQDRSKLNQQLIDIAARVRGVETKIDDTEKRLATLDARDTQIRGSLQSRRSEIVEVLAALQRAGRRAPPALLVRPEDALKSLRTAMLLGAVVPEMRVRADRLARDLSELVDLRKTIGGERDQLGTDRDGLKDDQTRLASLVEERQRKQSAIEQNMESERARAIGLSRQVDSLQGLIAKMEQDLASAAKVAQTASLQGNPAALTNGKPNLGGLNNPARLSPAIAFASAKGLFVLPVNGPKIRAFGGSDGAGGTLKTAVALDALVKNSYTIQVTSTDQGGLSVTNTFAITVLAINHAPTNITLSANSIGDDKVISTIIGSFTTTDQDAGNTFTYSLGSGGDRRFVEPA